MSKTISAGHAPKILIEMIGGDLSLVGWESDDILLKGDDDEIRVTQNGEEVKISCEDDLSIRVPKMASVMIASIEGDTSIRGILGDIELDEVEGDLSIRDVDSVAINTIHSDFSLRGAKGNLFVKSAHSDVSIREVGGNVTLESVADDLALRDVRGNITANVSEDVVLYLNPQPGKNYTVTAGEDILLVMPPKANARLTMAADEISIDWKGNELEDDATSGVIILGDGSANITLNAGSDIRVSNQSDAGESAEDFGNFAGIGMDWSGFGERISKQVAQATRQAAEAGRRAAEAGRRAAENERRARETRRHFEERGRGKVNVGVGRWNWDLSTKGTSMPPKPQASEEERLEILRMLQEKKITAEDADKLLSALEGQTLMSSEERRKILQLVADGKINADEAANLMHTLEESVEEEIEVIEAGPDASAERSDTTDFDNVRKRAMRWAMIPLWGGVLFTIFSAWGMYAIQQNAGYNFWFFCLGMPLFLGVLLIALTAGSMGSRWIYVNVDRTQAQDWPKNITIAFPLPLGLVSWFLKTFGSQIEGLKKTAIDEVIMAIAMTKTINEPLIVNVDEGKDGERVQVFIG